MSIHPSRTNSVFHINHGFDISIKKLSQFYYLVIIKWCGLSNDHACILTFSPPNWLFAPVWTILYVLMGISLYLVWTTKSKLKQRAITIFFIQLGLNTVWKKC
ncbi:MAG: tryptophan-rich sensory protein [Candidatus Blackburnbacteria bacterium]|nr:tryptophan-rich sensory protein [Candidatus Blackburnbacteria bacterium]